MTERICIINGHPDADPAHFVHAIGEAYAAGARDAGHEVRIVSLAEAQFDLIRSGTQWQTDPVPEAVADAQAQVRWCSHLVIVYPLWLGTMPALLKGFLEQLFRPGFAFDADAARTPWSGALRGRSARVIVTMGMPALFYRWVYRAHSLKSLQRNILGFVGFSPVRATVIGMVERGERWRSRWLERVRTLGRRAR